MSSLHPTERVVAITGLGIISPIGIGAGPFWESLAAARPGFGPIQGLSYSPLPGRIGGEVRDFNGAKLLRKDQRKGRKLMCREIEMGVASATLALDDAGFTDDAKLKAAVDPERLGVEFGANLMLSPPEDLGAGSFHSIDPETSAFSAERWGSKESGGMSKMEPLWLLKYLPNMPACHIGIGADARGPNNSLTMDEASGNLALGEAMRIIARNHADMMITGATGTRVHAIKSMHAVLWDPISPDGACRPFDTRRQGQVAAEGACTLILEEAEHAKARGAKIYGYILGAGGSCVLDKNQKPDHCRALVLAMNSALRDAEVTPDQIGHINAFGLGDKMTDLGEARAIHEVFGDLGSKVPVTALKSLLGNSGSGSGTLEFVGSIVGLQHGVVPPTANADQPDPECNLNLVRGTPLPIENKLFLKISVTRLGQASAIVARGA